MGIASVLLGENNPFAQWTNQNQNFLGAIGSGLAQGQNIQSGLSTALAAVPQAKQLDQEAAAKAKAEKLAETQANATKNWLASNHPDLAQMVEAGLPVSQAWQTAMDRMQPKQTDYPAEYDLFKLTQTDPAFADYLKGQGGGDQPSSVQEYEYARQNGFGGSYMEWLSGKGGATERSLTPTYLKDANGNIVIGQLDKGGQVTPSKLPEGFSAVDPFAMAGGKTGAIADAKTMAAARAALPGMETSVSIAKKAFELVRNDTAGRKQWFSQAGALPRGMWVQGGSPMANFQTNASQTLGQAFAQARETLKGGGPITDYEGKAAAEAYSRAEMALKQGDENAFLTAVDDMEAAILAGYQKLLETAQGDPSGGAIARASGGTFDPVTAADALLKSGKY